MGRVTVTIVCALLLMAACGSDSKDTSKSSASSAGGGGGQAAAEARVDAAQKGATAAEAAFTDAKTQFCTEGTDYLAAIDKYGKLFDQSAATVGDVKTLGADLAAPRASTQTAATKVRSTHDDLGKANQELDDANAALAAARASAASAPPPPSTTSTTLPPLPEASIDRVKTAETELTTASQGITDTTPIAEASVQYSSAVFVLEAAWLNLFSDAGCLTDQQSADLAEGVRQYAVAVQTALTTTGHYTAEIDGVYGPATVDAVTKLQTESGLPPTGLVDRATSIALDAAVAKKAGADAAKASMQTTAVQTMLKLAGFWPGAIDGVWTPELTTALMAFQTKIGVPPTGVVDIATLTAVQLFTTTGSTTTTSSTTTAPTSTTAPTATTAPTTTN